MKLWLILGSIFLVGAWLFYKFGGTVFLYWILTHYFMH